MKGFLTRFGHGAPDLDIDPGTDEVSPGESVEVRVDVEGGSVRQTAETIYTKVSATMSVGGSIAGAETSEYPTNSTMRALARATDVEVDVDPVLEYTMDTFEAVEGFTIEPGEHRTLTTTVEVPHATPLTMGDVHVWFGGKMKVIASRNPSSERRYVDVVPDERFEALFGAAEAMGLRFGGTTLDDGAHAHTEGSPFVELPYPFQLFRFHPETGPYSGTFDAVDLWTLATEDGMEVEVELPGGGETSVELEGTDADAVRERLEGAIDRVR